MSFKLLGTGNTKTVKGQKKGFLTFIMHLAPALLSGYNVCPMASKGCAFACLNTAGRGRFDKTQAARIKKTLWFFNDRAGFMEQMVKDIQAAERKAKRENLIPVFRLNGTSDIRWETIPAMLDGVRGPNVMFLFPNVQFYDYTKIPNRRDVPPNYHLTFSRSEDNDKHCVKILETGGNVAVVFSGALPKTWNGHKVISGDDTDLRFLDPKGNVIGLTAKGDAKKDTSGFVVIP